MRKYAVTGLVILLPVAITYWIIKFLINLATGPFEQFVQTVLTSSHLFPDGFGIFSHAQIVHFFAKILVIAFLLLVITLTGMIGRWYFISHFFKLFDQILHAVPFVNKVYLSCRDFTHALFSQKEGTFSQVVLVPFPSEKHLSVGLVTSEFNNEILTKEPIQYISVLIPGTPNPLNGFLMIYAKDKVTFTDIKVDEAIKYVMSCGSVLPEHLTPNKESLPVPKSTHPS
jgi:uncharacterized membrane protein